MSFSTPRIPAGTSPAASRACRTGIRSNDSRPSNWTSAWPREIAVAGFIFTGLSAPGYADFLTETCCDTLELTCWHDGRLVACAIADAGRDALSAVYTFFDPEFTLVSLGTYCALREAEFCRQTGRQYLYLGFYIAASPHMSYKASFHPHQRRIGGEWVDFS